MTIVELRNVSVRNKGAELMLRAMLGHLAGRSDVVVVGNGRVASRGERRGLGMRPLVYAQKKSRFFTAPASLPPAALWAVLGWTHPSRVDLVLDASGFAYGDPWGTMRTLGSARYYRYVKRHGARVVLMPQSFGPFEKPAVRAAATELFALADLIFPRDPTSAACVREIVGEDPRVVPAPDFTVLAHAEVPPGLELGSRPAAVIPNVKMLEKTTASIDDYADFVAETIAAFRHVGLAPFFLPHADADAPLVERIRSRFADPIAIVRESDPLRLKGIIGQCHAVMSSRFHGLVSALCQGVPVVATGWSHKYRHLLDEYGCPEALHRLDAPARTLRAAIHARFAEPARTRESEMLRARARAVCEQAQEMWRRIDALGGFEVAAPQEQVRPPGGREPRA